MAKKASIVHDIVKTVIPASEMCARGPSSYEAPAKARVVPDSSAVQELNQIMGSAAMAGKGQPNEMARNGVRQVAGMKKRPLKKKASALK